MTENEKDLLNENEKLNQVLGDLTQENIALETLIKRYENYIAAFENYIKYNAGDSYGRLYVKDLISKLELIKLGAGLKMSK